ncbi:hypothetical protein F2P81_014825 [Scophthalmus maximus]|uniref:Uncharacterized protein n=1 Tax=Scophthalmus maximus TaxID=52904 RepID=A0A6A4SIW6_SCOMX|nr:hypothetical protein F2P81_014825 [Scophthalmus maximus]
METTAVMALTASQGGRSAAIDPSGRGIQCVCVKDTVSDNEFVQHAIITCDQCKELWLFMAAPSSVDHMYFHQLFAVMSQSSSSSLKGSQSERAQYVSTVHICDYETTELDRRVRVCCDVGYNTPFAPFISAELVQKVVTVMTRLQQRECSIDSDVITKCNCKWCQPYSCDLIL